MTNGSGKKDRKQPQKRLNKILKEENLNRLLINIEKHRHQKSEQKDIAGGLSQYAVQSPAFGASHLLPSGDKESEIEGEQRLHPELYLNQ